MDTLIGLTSGQLLRLMPLAHFQIPPRSWSSLLKLSVLSVRNSIYFRKERERYEEQIQKTEIQQEPLFILGHWRSGTTLLHRLLSRDTQFAYPNMFEVYNPWTFLTTLPLVEEQLKRLPPEKRPMDNMMLTYNEPAEDEFALSLMSLESPLLGWAFPRQEAYFDRYLTFHEVIKTEREHWKEIFIYFIKKLTLKYNKPLLLKSPHHTARVKTLLEIFPNAKFIHIRRNPYDVFRSTVSLYEKTIAPLSLQKRDLQKDIQAIIERFRVMYDFFFEEQTLIKEGHLFEISFEELEQDFVKGIQKIYQGLNLPGWEAYKPNLQNFLSQQKEYKKNIYPPIDDKWKKQIQDKWHTAFDKWGYPLS